MQRSHEDAFRKVARDCAVENPSLYQVARLVSIVQRLSFKPVTYVLDDQLLQSLPQGANGIERQDEVDAKAWGAKQQPGLDNNAFASGFRAEFAEILPQMGLIRTNATTISWLFTDKQKQLLLKFFRDRMIPPGLFIEMTRNELLETGLTVAQRVLVSAHILAHGKVTGRGGVVDKPRALFCGHWVNWVWNYAGINPRTHTLAVNHGHGKLNVKGATGMLSFGTADEQQRMTRKAFFRGTMKFAPLSDGTQLPDFDYPLIEYSVENLKDLEIGDWLWFDTDNPWGHSVLFGGWEKSEAFETGEYVDYSKGMVVSSSRQALIFDQGNRGEFGKADGHGGRHYLGTIASRNLHRVDRVKDQDRDPLPARGPDEIFFYDDRLSLALPDDRAPTLLAFDPTKRAELVAEAKRRERNIRNGITAWRNGGPAGTRSWLGLWQKLYEKALELINSGNIVSFQKDGFKTIADENAPRGPVTTNPEAAASSDGAPSTLELVPMNRLAALIEQLSDDGGDDDNKGSTPLTGNVHDLVKKYGWDKSST